MFQNRFCYLQMWCLSIQFGTARKRTNVNTFLPGFHLDQAEFLLDAVVALAAVELAHIAGYYYRTWWWWCWLLCLQSNGKVRSWFLQLFELRVHLCSIINVAKGFLSLFVMTKQSDKAVLWSSSAWSFFSSIDICLHTYSSLTWGVVGGVICISRPVVSLPLLWSRQCYMSINSGAVPG